MNRTVGLMSAALLALSASAFAEPESNSKGGSMIRALEVVTENQAKSPQAPGLTNAQQQLGENALKHQENGHGHGASAERVERSERADRAERAERPDRAERPERPERPERVVRAERPDRPGKGH